MAAGRAASCGDPAEPVVEAVTAETTRGAGCDAAASGAPPDGPFAAAATGLASAAIGREDAPAVGATATRVTAELDVVAADVAAVRTAVEAPDGLAAATDAPAGRATSRAGATAVSGCRVASDATAAADATAARDACVRAIAIASSDAAPALEAAGGGAGRARSAMLGTVCAVDGEGEATTGAASTDATRGAAGVSVAGEAIAAIRVFATAPIDGVSAGCGAASEGAATRAAGMASPSTASDERVWEGEAADTVSGVTARASTPVVAGLVATAGALGASIVLAIVAASDGDLRAVAARTAPVSTPFRASAGSATTSALDVSFVVLAMRDRRGVSIIVTTVSRRSFIATAFPKAWTAKTSGTWISTAVA